MKKILAFILCVLMLTSLVACGTTETPAATAKFGAAVYVGEAKATDATADKEGQGSADITMAAVTVDADGKIVACRIDTMQNTLKYTVDGKAIGNPEAKTKRELGNDYGMSKIGKKEWFEQANALEGVVAGKTLDEVKALMVEGYKPGDALVAAGCTISIPDYIAAIEKAYNAAKNGPEVAADATLKIGMYTEQSLAEATADKDGNNSADVYGFAAAVDANGKVIKGFSDCVQLKFTFDTAGKSKFDATKAIKSKFEQGSDYGMTAIGKQEWYIQAAAFDTQCEGKTGAEIAGLVNADGKGVESVQTAGCTITVSGLVKAASKI